MAKKAKATKGARVLVRRAGYIFGVVDGATKNYWIDAPKNEARAQAWAPDAEFPKKARGK